MPTEWSRAPAAGTKQRPALPQRADSKWTLSDTLRDARGIQTLKCGKIQLTIIPFQNHIICYSTILQICNFGFLFKH